MGRTLVIKPAFWTHSSKSVTLGYVLRTRTDSTNHGVAERNLQGVDESWGGFRMCFALYNSNAFSSFSMVRERNRPLSFQASWAGLSQGLVNDKPQTVV